MNVKNADLKQQVEEQKNLVDKWFDIAKEYEGQLKERESENQGLGWRR